MAKKHISSICVRRRDIYPEEQKTALGMLTDSEVKEESVNKIISDTKRNVFFIFPPQGGAVIMAQAVAQECTRQGKTFVYKTGLSSLPTYFYHKPIASLKRELEEIDDGNLVLFLGLSLNPKKPEQSKQKLIELANTQNGNRFVGLNWHMSDLEHEFSGNIDWRNYSNFLTCVKDSGIKLTDNILNLATYNEGEEKVYNESVVLASKGLDIALKGNIEVIIRKILGEILKRKGRIPKLDELKVFIINELKKFWNLNRLPDEDKKIIFQKLDTYRNEFLKLVRPNFSVELQTDFIKCDLDRILYDVLVGSNEFLVIYYIQKGALDWFKKKGETFPNLESVQVLNTNVGMFLDGTELKKDFNIFQQIKDLLSIHQQARGVVINGPRFISEFRKPVFEIIFMQIRKHKKTIKEILFKNRIIDNNSYINGRENNLCLILPANDNQTFIILRRIAQVFELPVPSVEHLNQSSTSLQQLWTLGLSDPKEEYLKKLNDVVNNTSGEYGVSEQKTALSAIYRLGTNESLLVLDRILDNFCLNPKKFCLTIISDLFCYILLSNPQILWDKIEGYPNVFKESSVMQKLAYQINFNSQKGFLDLLKSPLIEVRNLAQTISEFLEHNNIYIIFPRIAGQQPFITYLGKKYIIQQTDIAIDQMSRILRIDNQGTIGFLDSKGVLQGITQEQKNGRVRVLNIENYSREFRGSNVLNFEVNDWSILKKYYFSLSCELQLQTNISFANISFNDQLGVISYLKNISRNGLDKKQQLAYFYSFIKKYREAGLRVFSLITKGQDIPEKIMEIGVIVDDQCFSRFMEKYYAIMIGAKKTAQRYSGIYEELVGETLDMVEIEASLVSKADKLLYAEHKDQDLYWVLQKKLLLRIFAQPTRQEKKSSISVLFKLASSNHRNLWIEDVAKELYSRTKNLDRIKQGQDSLLRELYRMQAELKKQQGLHTERTTRELAEPINQLRNKMKIKLKNILLGIENFVIPAEFWDKLADEISLKETNKPKLENQIWTVGAGSRPDNAVFKKALDMVLYLFYLHNECQDSQLMVVSLAQMFNYISIFSLEELKQIAKKASIDDFLIQKEIKVIFKLKYLSLVLPDDDKLIRKLALARLIAKWMGIKDENYYQSIISKHGLNIHLVSFEKLELKTEFQDSFIKIYQLIEGNSSLKIAADRLVEKGVNKRACNTKEDNLCSCYGILESATILALHQLSQVKKKRFNGIKMGYEKEIKYDILTQIIEAYSCLFKNPNIVNELNKTPEFSDQIIKAIFYHFYVERYISNAEILKNTATTINQWMKWIDQGKFEKQQGKVLAKIESFISFLSHYSQSSNGLGRDISLLSDPNQDLMIRVKFLQSIITDIISTEEKNLKIAQSTFKYLGLGDFDYKQELKIQRSKKSSQADSWKKYYSNLKIVLGKESADEVLANLPVLQFSYPNITAMSYGWDNKLSDKIREGTEAYSTFGISKEAYLSMIHLVLTTKTIGDNNPLAAIKLYLMSEKVQKKYLDKMLSDLIKHYYWKEESDPHKAANRMLSELGSVGDLATLIREMQRKIYI